MFSLINLTTEQTAKLNTFVNRLGDHFAKDPSDLKMHEAFIVIRKELTDEAPKLKELHSHQDWALFRGYLDWVDRILDRIEARRRSTISLQHSMAGQLR